MKILIYTAIFNNYDKVFPVLHPIKGVDYIVITDYENLHVRGWKTIFVDTGRYKSGKEANLHYKALVQNYFTQYNVSLYVDGNVRIIASPMKLIQEFLKSESDIGIYRHSERRQTIDEIAICASLGLADLKEMQLEYSLYRKDGFKDEIGLFDNAIILRNHSSPHLKDAMNLWWQVFEKHSTRDQLSFPYVVWKYKLKIFCFPGSSRNKNPFFHFYPHLKSNNRAPLSLILRAYSRDRFLFRFFFQLIHFSYTQFRRFFSHIL